MGKIKNWVKEHKVAIAFAAGVVVTTVAVVLLKQHRMDRTIYVVPSANPNEPGMKATLTEIIAQLSVDTAILDDLSKDEEFVPADILASMWYDKATNLPNKYKNAVFTLNDKLCEGDA